MSTVVSALMCHAPIVVPDVVGDRGCECAQSTRAMRAAAVRIVAKKPDVVVLVSPHTQRRAGFSIVAHDVAGDFADFGAPEVAVRFANAGLARERIKMESDAGELALSRLDHGALVPLFFLAEAGYAGPVVVAALPRAPTAEACREFGQAIARASRGQRWALVASGDCSHRLIPGAPAGFHPDAGAFDRALADDVARGGDGSLLDPALRELAAEDAVDSLAVAHAAAASHARRREVLSYEGPYGVGYLIAILDDDAEVHVLVDVARDALSAHISRGVRAAFDTSAVDALAYTGAFVTWRNHGALRGCVGRMSLDKPIGETVADLAVIAASGDPRFDAVMLDEIDELSAEVTLLDTSEPVVDAARDLDPAVYGVEIESGHRRGVLLPQIEGVNTVEQQLAIVKQKAGIHDDERYTLRRFRVMKVV